jgi:hypothetical protein
MSHEGSTLVMRGALTVFLIIVGAFFRALVGPSRRRGEIMLFGTLGGISLGVLFAYLISTDESAVYACLGITLGWCVSYLFAWRIPREAR